MISDLKSRVSGFGFYLLGLAFVVVGYFGTWVPHKTAALTVTGFELAKFAKFFPQVQGGVVPVTRVLFYFPLVAASVLLALFGQFVVGQSTIRPVRWIVPLCAAALLLVALLPYAVVESVRNALAARAAFVVDPQYAGHLALVVVGMALTLLAPLAGRLPRRVQSVLIVLLALVGAVPALWQFVVLRPLVIALYNRPMRLGWGLIVCTAGFGLLVLSGILAAVRPEQKSFDQDRER